MVVLLVDDHLLRDTLAGVAPRGARGARGRGELATTELFYHRLCASFARPLVTGRLSSPVAGLDAETQTRFRHQLLALPDDIFTVPIRELAWRMAQLKRRFQVSTLVAEALASAETLAATIAVDEADVGPRMETAAHELGLRFVVVRR